MATKSCRLEEVSMFKEAILDPSDDFTNSNRTKTAAPSSLPLNLISYDGLGRLFLWNSKEKLLHYVDVFHSSTCADASAAEPAYLAAASQEYKTMKLSCEVNFKVRGLKFNRNGQALLLVGDGALMMVEVVPQLSPFTSSSPSNICRAVIVGEDTIFNLKYGRSLRILDVAWHPYSDTHVGILSSDGVFRLFDLSQDTAVAEQEYHLQVDFSGKNLLKAFPRILSFAFGGEHLWDRFTVFFLFTDGSIYALCPIVPFGSMYNISGIEELKKDAGRLNCGVSISNSSILGNSSRSAAWLDAVFPDLCDEPNISSDDPSASFILKARGYVPLDASLYFQGPFPTVWGEVQKDAKEASAHINAATNLIYSNVGKDSILAVSLKDGQLLLYALADEVQPMWNTGGIPRVVVDDDGHLLSSAMLVEASDADSKQGSARAVGSDMEPTCMGDIALTGQPPPLLQLARVDLALEKCILETGPLLVLTDPVVPERLYCCHAAGIDVILLQWLPFSDQVTRRTTPGVPPLVFPVLDIHAAGDAPLRPILGVTTLSDILGETWLVAVMSSGKASVVEMDGQRLSSTYCFEGVQEVEEKKNLIEAAAGSFPLINAELLRGPKDIHIPQVSSSGNPISANSIEGRTLLHDQWKLLREKYIEYAHRMYVELSSHGARLGDVLQDLNEQLHQAQETLNGAHVLSSSFTARVKKAFDRNLQLHERIKKLSLLPAVRSKPLTAAEQSFKTELGRLFKFLCKCPSIR